MKGSCLKSFSASPWLSASMTTIEPVASPFWSRKGPARISFSPSDSRCLRCSGRLARRSLEAVGLVVGNQRVKHHSSLLSGRDMRPATIEDIEALPVKQQIDRFDQRHVDIERVARWQSATGAVATPSASRCRRCGSPRPERHAVAVVARLGRGAGEGEVAEAGEAGEGRRPSRPWRRRGGSVRRRRGRSAPSGPRRRGRRLRRRRRRGRRCS